MPQEGFIKFNDPNGDIHQRRCHGYDPDTELYCKIVDYKTGDRRFNMDNAEIDIYYKSDLNGCFTVDDAPVKCISCPHLEAHVTE